MSPAHPDVDTEARRQAVAILMRRFGLSFEAQRDAEGVVDFIALHAVMVHEKRMADVERTCGQLTNAVQTHDGAIQDLERKAHEPYDFTDLVRAVVLFARYAGIQVPETGDALAVIVRELEARVAR